MEKNYYEILEIDKNASKEIIEKAYKTLVKKYHPDLQDTSLKNNYEEKIKKINEAYEVLSNPEKRENYNLNLKNTIISIEEYNNIYNENINLKKELNYLKNNNINNSNNINSNNNNLNTNYNNYYENYSQDDINRKINEKIDDAVNQAYYDAYIQDLKNRGYKIKYKKTFKDFLAIIITILIIIFIGFILWQIPFTRNYFINFYNENQAFKFIVDFFLNFFQ